MFRTLVFLFQKIDNQFKIYTLNYLKDRKLHSYLWNESKILFRMIFINT